MVGRSSTSNVPKGTPARKRKVAASKTFRAVVVWKGENPYIVRRSLGLKVRSMNALRDVVHSGIEVRSYEHFRRLIAVTNKELLRVLAISQRTLERRRTEGRFNREESDRLARLCMLYEFAVKLFKGNQQRAAEWFRTPKPALGNASPLEYADTEPGAQEVRDLIGRLEHGVYS